MPSHWLLLAWIVLWLGMQTGSDFTAAQPPEDQPQGPALSPSESLSQFHVPPGMRWEQLLTEPTITQPLMVSFDARGRLWLVEYRQYPEPAGLKALSRDNFWRMVYDRHPLPPGHGGEAGLDRISIHEDRDGDGALETHTTFLDGLNIATAVVPDAGGAWVLNPPYLLYYRDSDQDGKADGTPEVHLQGFGLEDTHSVVNNLCLGPDGWLYAAQGSTVTAQVRRTRLEQPLAQPEEADATQPAMKSLGQLLWRYHPHTREYEVFAEGGGNAFGVAFDSQGRLFSGHNGGDTRGFHYLQGAYYRKGFTKHGSLSNPYAFGFFEPMKHDTVQRFTHTMLLTDGTSLQDKTKSMIAVDPLHGKLFHTDLTPAGPTFTTRDREQPLSCDDKWFRPVAIHTGPDGAAYVCDWYDFQVAHLYAHVGKMDRDHGRVYRLSRAEPSPQKRWDSRLALDRTPLGLEYLHRCLSHPYRWQRWKAIELLCEHPLRETLASKVAEEAIAGPSYWLERLWLAHVCGWIADTIPYTTRSASEETRSHFKNIDWLAHPDPMVRSWWIRLLGDDRQIDPASRQRIERQIAIETDVEVIAQALCTAKRLPAQDAFPIIASWLSNPRARHEQSLETPMLSELTWWAIEQHADAHHTLIPWLLNPDQWNTRYMEQLLIPNLVQRWTMKGDAASLQSLSELLRVIESLPPMERKRFGQSSIVGLDRAFQGKTVSGLDSTLLGRFHAIGELPLSFRLRADVANAVDEASRVLMDPKQPAGLRLQIARLAKDLGHPVLWPILQELALAKVADEQALALQVAALASMKGFIEQPVAEFIIEHWRGLEGESLVAAATTLASRPRWSLAWLEACRTGVCDPQKLPIEAQRAMRLHHEPSIDRELDRYFPPVSGMDLATAQWKARQLEEWILEGHGDPYAGKKIYKNLCGRCHKLFDQGGEVGPDLTGYQRDLLLTLLQNTLAPNLEIREGYQSLAAVTTDGEVMVGIMERQAEDAIILRGVDGQSHRIDRNDLQTLKPQNSSLMPEGILESLSPQELRDLFGYLRSSQPLFDGT